MKTGFTLVKSTSGTSVMLIRHIQRRVLSEGSEAPALHRKQTCVQNALPRFSRAITRTFSTKTFPGFLFDFLLASYINSGNAEIYF